MWSAAPDGFTQSTLAFGFEASRAVEFVPSIGFENHYGRRDGLPLRGSGCNGSVIHGLRPRILLLQGGGALGAYQAGVYEGLVEAGVEPNWVVGISIGAINAALIVGNPPERRVERLREFWRRISVNVGPPLPAWLDSLRPAVNNMAAMSAATIGVAGFYRPRMPPASFAADGTEAALSVYDTTPLKATLEELVDFDLINRGQVRLSLGAVNVCKGTSTYFDTKNTLSTRTMSEPVALCHPASRR